MRLPLSQLKRLVDLPSDDPAEIRRTLDESGIEVKGVAGEGGGAVFTVETLANRADHLSWIGIARELSARHLAPLRHPALATLPSGRGTSVPVKRQTGLCPRYALLEAAVPPELALPHDVRAALGEDGRKPAVVDLVNFVQAELGQPMHAFDRDLVAGEVVIRQLETETRFAALDGRTYDVPAAAIVIADQKKILAVAGVIGGADSCVGEKTTRILVESAAFDPVSVRKTARAMGLATDASRVFERGSDPEAVSPALRRFLLLAQGAHGSVQGAASVHALGYTLAEAKGTERRAVPLRFAPVRSHVNAPRLSDTEVTARLKYLGFGVDSVTEKGCVCVVPSWRLADVESEADLIEEYVRASGYSRVKPRRPLVTPEVPPYTPEESVRSLLDGVLTASGYFEVVTKGFYGEDVVRELEALLPGSAAGHLRVKNSIDKANSALKITDLVHLLGVAASNERTGASSVKVFEFCRLFRGRPVADDTYPYEYDALTLLAAGGWHDAERGGESEVSVFRYGAFKGLIESLFAALHAPAAFAASSDPFFHPGKQASVSVGKTVCGTFGVVHPALSARAGVREEVLGAAFRTDALAKVTGEPRYRAVSPYPAAVRDVTLAVPPRRPAAAVTSLVRSLAPAGLESVRAVDSFEKEGETSVRLTLRLTYRLPDRTTTREEVDAETARVVDLLASKHGLPLAG